MKILLVGDFENEKNEIFIKLIEKVNIEVYCYELL